MEKKTYRPIEVYRGGDTYRLIPKSAKDGLGGNADIEFIISTTPLPKDSASNQRAVVEFNNRGNGSGI